MGTNAPVVAVKGRRIGARLPCLAILAFCWLSTAKPQQPAAATCSAPQPPANGAMTPQARVYSSGDEIYFYCDETYSIASGSPGCAVCVVGQWMPDIHASPPVCIGHAPLSIPGKYSALSNPNRRNCKCNLSDGKVTQTGTLVSYPYANLQMETFPSGAPWLQAEKTLTDGLAFVGLSLTRNHVGNQPLSHPHSTTRQKQFDFNEIMDRNYTYYAGTSDDGWLAGGGENGESFKLPNNDSAHIELMRVGSFNTAWGGADLHVLSELLSNGSIMIPHMAIMPSFVNARGFGEESMPPPEMEVRWNLEPSDDLDTSEIELWPNWQLAFVHNQLYRHITFPARFCPSPFHMTFTRNGQFRDMLSMQTYLEHASRVVQRWRQNGPTVLEPESNPLSAGYPSPVLGQELTSPHGVYIFKSRAQPLAYFAPNFHPPYNTSEKRAIIREFLSSMWNPISKQFERSPWEKAPNK